MAVGVPLLQGSQFVCSFFVMGPDWTDLLHPGLATDKLCINDKFLNPP